MTAATVRVEQLLAELGDTADAVADRLRALEIKGVRGSDCNCPVAEYLKRAGLTDVSVGDWIFTGQDADELDTPQVIRDFIERFDKGVYLDLVEAVADA